MRSVDELIAESLAHRDRMVINLQLAAEKYFESGDPLEALAEIERWLDRIHRDNLDLEIFDTLKWAESQKSEKVNLHSRGSHLSG